MKKARPVSSDRAAKYQKLHKICLLLFDGETPVFLIEPLTTI
jgi:hypothetical protein